MSSFYQGLAASAARLIKDKGQSMRLVVTSTGAYDDLTGTTPTSESRASVFGVELAEPSSEEKGTAVAAGQKKILLSVEGVASDPKPQDALLIGGVRHEIVTCKKLAPSGVAVIYTLQVKVGG